MTNSESLNDCDECLVDHVLLYYSENACCNSTTMIPINWYDMSIFDCNWLMMWLIIRWTGMSVCETECNGCIYLNLKWTVCVIQCNVVHFTANKPAVVHIIHGLCCSLRSGPVLVSCHSLFLIVVDHFYNMALFSTLVTCDSKWALLFMMHFEYAPKCTYWTVWLLNCCWCHKKLLLSWCKFCVHHTTMHHVTSCKATYVRCMRV